MSLIIGLSGQAGVGKDTAADYLVKKYGFVKIALADGLKRAAKEWYGFSDTQLWGPSEERNKPDLRYPIPGKGHLSPRTALQALGTEVGRSIWQDTWVVYTLNIAKRVLSGSVAYNQKRGAYPHSWPLRALGPKPTGVVISDVRFKNEIQAIQNFGGVVVRLRREIGDLKAGIAGHASEEEQKSIPDHDFDFVVPVPDGIPAYHVELDKLYTRIPKNTRHLRVAKK